MLGEVRPEHRVRPRFGRDLQLRPPGGAPKCQRQVIMEQTDPERDRVALKDKAGVADMNVVNRVPGTEDRIPSTGQANRG
jgi:hypothetical protein